ncbi:hypothetical protein RAAC3_TM7C00001G0517 [Candidatus Saccharibacteria bacterium RAAC3_TM7_1]|nr:hypothetical protein RAAC3_TM7C00001G0517 [Candidatus Saccharibacteria bacterium RAAC3_TM7_1]HCZ28644.1 prepilin-type N-terminal cleavage/methylation domain-containing protein [Candidatus Saccharibacteria bacterium]
MIKTTSGFTIVELLIVIVVIAILAAITIVAYNGIQGRAQDSTIKADITTLMKKLELYKIDHSDTYPMNNNDLNALNMRISGGAYDTTTTMRNALYCFTSDGSAYAYLAKSKSGNAFIVTNTSPQIQPFTTTWTPATGASGLCSGLGAPFSISASTGFYSSWNPWTNYSQ